MPGYHLPRALIGSSLRVDVVTVVHLLRMAEMTSGKPSSRRKLKWSFQGL